MSIKRLLVLFLSLSLFFQILFSVYYSSEIINQNNKHANLLEEINRFEIEHQNLKIKLASETSLNKLSEYLKNKRYLPIWQEINLKQQ